MASLLETFQPVVAFRSESKPELLTAFTAENVEPSIIRTVAAICEPFDCILRDGLAESVRELSEEKSFT
jgi:hypothetical protein